jgi:hypothetical protein
LQCEWKGSGLLHFFLSLLSLYLVAIAAAPTGIRIRRERKRKLWEKGRAREEKFHFFPLVSTQSLGDVEGRIGATCRCQTAYYPNYPSSGERVSYLHMLRKGELEEEWFHPVGPPSTASRVLCRLSLLSSIKELKYPYYYYTRHFNPLHPQPHKLYIHILIFTPSLF